MMQSMGRSCEQNINILLVRVKGKGVRVKQRKKGRIEFCLGSFRCYTGIGMNIGGNWREEKKQKREEY